MTRDEAVAEIQRHLGFHTGLTADIQAELKTAQVALEHAQELPYFLKSEYSYIDTTADESRIPLPSDFLRELDEEDCMYWEETIDDRSSWVALEKVPASEGRYRWPDTGEPKLYSLDNSYFRLYPTPDDNYRIFMQYYAKDTVLDTNIENNWLLYRPQLLIARAGMHMASAVRDDRAAQYFSGLYQVQWKEMTDEETARLEAASSRQRGEAD